MKKNIVLKLLTLIISFCLANQAYGWHFNVTNLSPIIHQLEATYPGCGNDMPYISPGQTVKINAKECLLGKLMVHNHRQVPYIGPTRVYEQFYIIGPVEGEYLIGRFE